MTGVAVEVTFVPLSRNWVEVVILRIEVASKVKTLKEVVLSNQNSPAFQGDIKGKDIFSEDKVYWIIIVEGVNNLRNNIFSFKDVEENNV